MTTAQSYTSRLLVAYRRIVIVSMIVTAVLYSAFVLYPAYSTGIYRLSDEQIERFSIHIPMLENSGLALSPALILFFTFFITVPLSVIQLLALLSRRDGLSREQKVFWLVITLELWLALYVTLPAAGAIATWAFD